MYILGRNYVYEVRKNIVYLYEYLKHIYQKYGKYILKYKVVNREK